MFNFAEWVSATHRYSQKEFIDLLMKNKLLKNIKICPNCSVRALFVTYKRHKNEYAWHCMNKECDKYQTYYKIRQGSFFERFSSDLKFIFRVLLFKSNGVQQSSIVDAYPRQQKKKTIFPKSEN